MLDSVGETRMAVCCRSVHKELGSGRNKVKVLCGLNMSVPYGCIYGLLGSSGCGKTTLLKCILGKLKIDKGHLNTLEKVPGSKDHLVPGRMVGYMPQDICLFLEFTIRETLAFFGRLHGMNKENIKERTEFLVTFLHLPDNSRLVSQLSGGQQRRVSLATALLHEPELLILDEPTVGVDPVLREKIWEHLLEIARSNMKTTIIITTHYIEEAAQADKVGLMRGGRLLAENKPSALTAHYSLPNLEAIFLHLCHRDKLLNNDDDALLPSTSEPSPHEAELENQVLYKKETRNGDSAHLLGASRTVYGTLARTASAISPSRWCSPRSFLPVPRNVLALSLKNLISMRRNLTVLMFEILIPVVQITLFCLCIGREPRGLSVSVCNEDKDGLGDLFLRFLNNHTISKVMKDDFQAAINDVKMGLSWGAIHVSRNFSMDLMARIQDGLKATNTTLEGSSIWLYLDNTDQQIALTIQVRMVDAFNTFTDYLMSSFGYNPDIVKIPLKLGDPVYGTRETSFTDFMCAGLIVSSAYFLAVGLTTLSFVIEKKQGLLERIYVAGVNSLEIMLAHINTQLLITFGQIMVMLAIAFLGFGTTLTSGYFFQTPAHLANFMSMILVLDPHVPNNGNFVVLVMLIVLQGLCGMTLGLVISVCCETEVAAVQCVLGVMYPSLLLNGIIWPIEAMPDWLMNFSKCLPQTYPTFAVRSIMGRGWGLDMTLIWSSYLITIAWIVIQSIFAMVVVHLKAD